MANYGAKNKKVKNSTVYTPEILSNYLYQLISEHYEFKYILDPCIGEGALAKPFKKDGVIIVGNDIDKKGLYDHINYCTFKMNFNIKDFRMPNMIKPDFIIMNPPFNGNGKGRKNLLYPHLFLKTMFDNYGEDIPLVMITGDNFLNNNNIKSDRLKYISDGNFEVTSIITLPINIFPNVKFNTQILFFNMPKLKPHYIFDASKPYIEAAKVKPTKPKNKILKEYYRYNLSKEENNTFRAEADYIIDLLTNEIDGQDPDSEEYQELKVKILNLKNILNNVKHIKLSDNKINATEKARRVNKNRSRDKIKKAYEDLKFDNKKITIYSIAKKAKVAHPTAAKYIDIFKEDLV